MRRTIEVFRSKEQRAGLWYDLVRVWVEHRYHKELKILSVLIGQRNWTEAKKLIEELERSKSYYYLGPELARTGTLLDFLSED